MAAIYLDNLVKPRQTNVPTTILAQQPAPDQYTYTDLHLDLKFLDNIGNGWNTVKTKDIQADYDNKAIGNSIVNILTTRPGWKVLSPTFGCRLDKYLFEPLSEFRGSVIANDIKRAIENFEPRITLEHIWVVVSYDDNQYYFEIKFKINQSGLLNTLQLKFNTQALSLNDMIIV